MRNSFTSLAKTSCTSLTPLVHVQKLPTARDDAYVYTCAWFYVDAGRHWQAASSHVNHVCATHEAVFYRGEDGQVREEDVGIEWPRARTDLEERGIIFLSSSFLLLFFFHGERGVGGISFFGKKFLFGKVGGRGEKQGNMEIIGKFAFQKALGALGWKRRKKGSKEYCCQSR